MSRAADRADAQALGWCMDLVSLVARTRADRAETLPEDPVFALALVVLSGVLDHDELVHHLHPGDGVLEGAAATYRARSRHKLLRREIDRLTKNPSEQKENP